MAKNGPAFTPVDHELKQWCNYRRKCKSEALAVAQSPTFFFCVACVRDVIDYYKSFIDNSSAMSARVQGGPDNAQIYIQELTEILNNLPLKIGLTPERVREILNGSVS